MNVRTFCSGIGAPETAWADFGWRFLSASEIDPQASAVLAARHPGVPNVGDMTTCTERMSDEPTDLVVGGTPCQSFSVAGLRRGLADPRGNLALVYLGLVDRLRPRWMVWENVPGVLSSGRGRDFGAFLGALGKLGYGFAYRVLDAQYVRVDTHARAVPQRRRRVFVVGYLGDWRHAGAVLLERASLCGHPAPCREAGSVVASGLARGLGSGGADAARAQAGWLQPVANPLTARMHEGVNSTADEGQTMVVAHTLRATGHDASEDGTGRGTPVVPVAFSAKDHGADAGALAPTLRAMGHAGSHPNGGGQVAVAFTQNQRNELRLMDVAGALAAEPGAKQQTYAKQGAAVRRLTPRECERLQGFPDDYTAVEWRGKPMADGPRYRMIGNSMAVNVMRWIGQRIKQVEAAA